MESDAGHESDSARITQQQDTKTEHDYPPSTHDELDSPLSEESANREDDLHLKVVWRKTEIDIDTNQHESIQSIGTRLARATNTDIERIKIWLMPTSKILKHPFGDTRVGDVLSSPHAYFKLVATPREEVAQDTASLSARARRGGGRATKTGAAPSRSRDWAKIQDESKYTFHAIQPLPYLPNPEKSKRFLERLATDPGIKASMRKHKFSVGLLTEMNPAEHTTQESRTLGLNRNRGEVIELRLRTDRYDGYRDYKVIRKTLCHELSHNVWGDHDRNFWDLTKQIEQEVEQGDWKHGGHKLTNDEFFNPDDDATDADHADEGGWTGGEFVLGRSVDSNSNDGLTRREILAKAAMSRLEKDRGKGKGNGEDEKK